MKIVLNVSLAYLENEFNRKIEVDDSIKLTDLCEYIIVSFNGNCKHVYDLEMNNGENYLSYIPYNDDIDGTLMNDLRLCDIGINKDSYFALYYGDENSALWKFDIDVDSISNDKTDIDFKVIDGKGVGIIDDINNSIYFYDLFDENIPDKNKGYIIERIKGYDEWNNSKFTVESNNEKIDEYKRKQIRLCMPKNYILNVTLDGFDSLIKRKISVDGDISLSDLCRGIILSMNGVIKKKVLQSLLKKYHDLDMDIKSIDSIIDKLGSHLVHKDYYSIVNDDNIAKSLLKIKSDDYRECTPEVCNIINEYLYEINEICDGDDELVYNINTITRLGGMNKNNMAEIKDEFNLSKSTSNKIYETVNKYKNKLPLWPCNGYNNLNNSKTVKNEKKIGRNEPCPCRSGKKYKKCCGG